MLRGFPLIDELTQKLISRSYCLPVLKTRHMVWTAADPLLERRQTEGKHGSVLVVGLGGGALPIYLHSCLGLAVDSVELDSTVVGLARRHFGFADVSSEPSLTVRQIPLFLGMLRRMCGMSVLPGLEFTTRHMQMCVWVAFDQFTIPTWTRLRLHCYLGKLLIKNAPSAGSLLI